MTSAASVTTIHATHDLCAQPAAKAADTERRLLRRAVAYTLLATVAFGLGCMAVNAAVNALGARAAVVEPFRTKLDAAFAAEPPYDTIFLGSSRVHHGIDPVRFDAEMMRRGTRTRSFNLGIDALNFPEAIFVLEQVIARSGGTVKRIILEPSLRARLAPGLEYSARAIALHDAAGAWRTGKLVMDGNFETGRKAFWLASHSRPTAARLTNVGVLTERYIIDRNSPIDRAELLGAGGDGFVPLEERPAELPPLTTDQIRALPVASQPFTRTLSDGEIKTLNALATQAAAAGITLILAAPPTAQPEIFAEFAAVDRASRDGRLTVAVLNYADQSSYPDLYDPAGFFDPDHILAPVAEMLTTHLAEDVARLIPLSVEVAGGSR